MKRGPPNSPILYKHCPRPSYLSHHLHSQRQTLINNHFQRQSHQQSKPSSSFRIPPDFSNQVLQNIQHSSTMQFKSIVAVLALAVAVVATPVEPVAVNVVARTDPPTVQNCPAKQVLLSKCSTIGIPLLSGSNSAGLLSLIQALIQIGATVSCVRKSLKHTHFFAPC